MSMIAALFPPDRRSMEVQWRYQQKREWRQKAKGFCACGALEVKPWPPMCACARARRRVVSAYYNSIAPFHPFVEVVVVLYRCFTWAFHMLSAWSICLHSRFVRVSGLAPVEQVYRCKAQNSWIVGFGALGVISSIGRKGGHDA
jgi:hypothetical protein